MGASHVFPQGGTTVKRRIAAIAAGIATAAMALGGVVAPPATAYADEPAAADVSSVTNPNNRHFMVYYRAWRDVTMKGVNTDLPDENWISMYDIPYGVDVVNVFSYVPAGQEAAAQPFYDKLKAEYAPYLHSRGIKLVRGINYEQVTVEGFRDYMADLGKTADEATEADYDAYALEIIDEYMTSVGLDGLDIDMETYPTDADVAISDNVIRALSKHIGPKSDDPDGTMFLYDTNGSNTKPFANVADCFDYVAYQQYGSTSTRTAGAVADYSPYIGADKFVPGLAFPEEGDHNRWYDATEPYTDSHIYDIASYVRDNGLGGMFLYALDRDGRTYEAEDWSHIVPSNLLWTKTAIAESQDMTMEQAKAAANHYIERMSLTEEGAAGVALNAEDALEAVEQATNLYEVNKAVLGGDYDEGFSNTYDPTLEVGLLGVDTTELMDQISAADNILAGDVMSDDVKSAVRQSRDAAVEGLTGRTYTADEVAMWTADLQADIEAAMASLTGVESSDRHFMVYYRAWRDVTMKGVNTDLPDENWISMYDIPYGVDVVNVFSYVPAGQEAAAQPYYDKLKSDYAPYLHSRGIKLVRGVDYTGVIVDGFRDFIEAKGLTEQEATEADYDEYALQVIDEYMTSVGLDGLDIDMETHPDEADVAVSDNVIRALSKHIGPKSDDPDGTMFLYDTNASDLAPFRNVADCFDYVAYQQYGSNAERTDDAFGDYAPHIGSEFVPGLTFPEEGDMNNRWYDATEPYEESNFYQVASYVNEHDLGGMFVYALDRDGRDYEDDLTRIVPSNLLWTKTAIAESQGMPLDQAKAAANHYIERMSLASAEGVALNADEAGAAVAAAANLYEVNKAVLGGDYDEGFSNTYDPTLEAGLLDIDIDELMSLIEQADKALEAEDDDTVRTARDAAMDGLTGKIYTADEVGQWVDALTAALKGEETPSGPDDTSKPNTDVQKPADEKPLASSGSAVTAVLSVAVAAAVAGIGLTVWRRRKA
ncbi:hypothetical protein [uncultured Bifidobacterium sp.]|nr:hypothetical protein [uncultured Bifidobacterium sp.]